MRITRLTRVGPLVLLLVACARDDGAVALAARAGRDAALPRDSALAADLARFRDGLPRRDTLAHAAPSADALVRDLVARVSRADTLGLTQLHVSRSEWAWLVYPESRYTTPPLRQRPQVTWLLLAERSNSGLARLVGRRGGQPMTLVRWGCTEQAVDGPVRYQSGCSVTWRGADGQEVTERWFGALLERDGRFKVASYANQF